METVDRILLLLQERGIEQKALADYIGISAQGISQWKAGRNQSYKRHIDKIAQFLDVSVDYLLGKDEIKKRPSSEDVERINKAMQESPIFKSFAEDFLSLSLEDQKKMQEFARFLIHSNIDAKR